VKTAYLVLYDYESGGAWFFLLAESADQIGATFPKLTVMEQRPAWMDADEEERIRAEATLDIDDLENPILAGLHRQSWPD
jgi:hypothetical protein